MKDKVLFVAVVGLIIVNIYVIKSLNDIKTELTNELAKIQPIIDTVSNLTK